VKERTKDRVALALALALAALVALEALAVPHEHPYFPWHRVPGYAAVIGFVAALLLVRLTKSLGKWFLQRPEPDE
jgi:hypothetical protein